MIRNPFSKHTKTQRICALLTLMSVVAPSGTLWANPTGGTVARGNANIKVESPTRTIITQTTDRAIINWNSFSIAKGEQTVFRQPSASSIILNRVTGSDPSKILGQLIANGRVVLINPNGVFFGKDSRVDVAALIASTHDIKNDDFMAGNLSFTIPGKPNAGIVNEGTITAKEGGLVALVAPWVHNSGLIQARLGKVVLASSNGVTIDLYGDNLITFEADSKLAQSLYDTDGKPITNLVNMDGRIEADGGTVLLTANAAKGIVDRAINMTGHIQATTVDTSTGKIILQGGDGNLAVSGTLDASAPNGGDGGFIDTSAAHVSINPIAKITTASLLGKDGTWLIDPTDFIIGSGGDMRAADLVNYLNSTNIEIQTAATGIENGDIYVNEGITWGSANKFTLTAHRNIYVNQAINAAGGGSVKLRADSTGSGTGSVYFGNSGHITANGGAVGIYYNPLSYTDAATKSDASSNPYSSKVTLNGGSSMNAYMLVNNVNQLQNMNQNLYGRYALGRDIDASATAGWNSGAGFAPVGDGTDWAASRFFGIFDGQNRQISDLYINRNTVYATGLFGVLDYSGVIQNVTLSGGTVRNQYHLGSLAGDNFGTIYNAHSTTTVIGSNNTIGGLVGMNSNGNISYSSYVGSVSGVSWVGGLAGLINGGATINNCYSAGSVSGSGNRVGGLIGSSEGFSTLSNSFNTANVVGTSEVGGLIGTITSGSVNTSYSSGPVMGSSWVGGLIGRNYNNISISANNYWNTETSLAGSSEGGTGLTSAQMKQQASFNGWDFTNAWTIQNGVSYPTLRTSSASGSLVLQPGVLPNVNTVQMFNKYNGASAVTLLNGILAGELRNDPKNAVWHALYQNGSATANQIEADRLWNIYDDYRTASADTLASALRAGIFTSASNDPIWNALAVNPNRQAALDILTGGNDPCLANPSLCNNTSAGGGGITTTPSGGDGTILTGPGTTAGGPGIPPAGSPNTSGSINMEALEQLQQASTPLGALSMMTTAFSSMTADAAAVFLGNPLDIAKKETELLTIAFDRRTPIGPKIPSDLTQVIDEAIFYDPQTSIGQQFNYLNSVSTAVGNALSIYDLGKTVKGLFTEVPELISDAISAAKDISNDVTKIKLLSNLIQNAYDNQRMTTLSDVDKLVDKIELFQAYKSLAKTDALAKTFDALSKTCKAAKESGAGLAEVNEYMDKAILLLVGGVQLNKVKAAFEDGISQRLFLQQKALEMLATQEHKTIVELARDPHFKNMKVYAEPESHWYDVFEPNALRTPEVTTLGQLFGV